MSKYSIQDILPLVEKPSRYLGTETNTIKKDPSTVRLRIALAFPDLYEIGTSHFGLLILYHILNRSKEIAAERVFAPGLDMEAKLRISKLPILSLESQTPLLEFDIVGFSLLYELNYTNILSLLDLSNIPFYASQRDNSYPLIIAGGPCTCNPEPVADFFDAMVIGDGENVILEMSDIWLVWNKSSGGDKDSLLRKWSRLEGVYVPAYFKPRFDTSGYQILEPRLSDYTRVTRTITNNLDQAPFPEAPVVPFGRPVHDRLRLEVSRGCTRGCRFCQAGIIYRPVRERSMEKLIDLTTKSLEATGYEDMSLLSLSTGDYACIVPLLECLMTKCQASQIAISLPSLRAGTLTTELMHLIKRVRKTGFTIAPEAGSQRLRDVINKNVTDKDIRDTVTNAFDLSWRLIKLYFMIGLPTETEDDLHAMVNLVKDLRKLSSSQGFKGKINVSLATFIPKPHTPFQWIAQNSLAESFEKLEWIKKNLNLPGVHLKWQNPQVSILEG
ncbi:MAG: TIGR03960 family B12-binding radical SAM protein, partial [Deltaproteobacteria bacterium]